MACKPQPASTAVNDVPVPMLSAEEVAAWAAFEERRCGSPPPTPPDCEPAKVQAAIESSCDDASTCIPALRRARRCEGGGNAPLVQGDPLEDPLDRMVAEDCDGVVDAMMASPEWGAPWWASGPLSEQGMACIERSEHPHARALLLARGTQAQRAWLLEDVEATAAWMQRYLERVPSSPPGFLEALEFWDVFDQMPPEQKAALIPAIRDVASIASIDAWTTKGWRIEAVDRLGALGGAGAVVSLRVLLNDGRHWTVQAHAAHGLASLGPLAAPARADLEAISEGHWSILVRAKAARAIRSIAGEDAPEVDPQEAYEPLDPGDPEVMLPVLGQRREVDWRRYEPWSVELDGRRHAFAYEPVDCPELPDALASLDLEAQFPDHYGIRKWQLGLSLVLPVEGGWILGMDKGEFGGGAWFVDPDLQARLLTPGNIKGQVELGGSRYLVQGLGHMGTSDGALLRVVEQGGRADLELATELPEAPHAFTVVDDQLLQATLRGMYVIASDLTIELHPFATTREPPRELPGGYLAALKANLERDHDALQRCLHPLSGLLPSCDPQLRGTSVWLDVDARGAVSHVVPMEPDVYGRPPAPEVTACVGQVAAEWTFPAFEDGWTSFGVTLPVE